MSLETLTQFIYVSKNMIPKDALFSEIESILHQSRRNNARYDITGALVFNEGCFAQILEGPEDNIESLWEKILADTRHDHCMVLSSNPAEKRSFSGWRMAYHGIETQAAKKFGELLKVNAETGGFLTGEQVFKILLMGG